MKNKWLLVLLAVSAAGRAAEFQGAETAYGKEHCFVLTRFAAASGARYRESDTKKEQALCHIDFYANNIGLCPKTWSTSPGTEIYDLQQSAYKENPAKFEVEYCPKQRALKGKVAGVDKLAAYKQSVNGQFKQSTSATFAQASPLYYHFSRYLNLLVDIPVAVIRTMDAKTHLQRVASKGPALAQGKMNLAGWNLVKAAEQNPSGYQPINEFYYGDSANGLLYGTLLKGHGQRYGAEFNGNIAGKGYTDEYTYWQKTAAFSALSSTKKFADTMTAGMAAGKTDPLVAKALTAEVSAEQMQFWMQELSEIAVIDYIFSQQDRPGNIDYVWVWYYVDQQGKVQNLRDDSEVSRLKLAAIPVPDAVKNSSHYVLIQKTQLNDNDAGGRKYANFTKKFGLVEKIRHFNALTYRQLIGDQ